MSATRTVQIGCAVPDGPGGTPITVEVTIRPGADSFQMAAPDDGAGMAEWLRSALTAAGWDWPSGCIAAAATPSPDRRAMPALDLGLAAGVLAASHQIPAEAVEGCVLVGALDPSGRLEVAPGAWLAVDAVVDAVHAGPILTDPRTAGWFAGSPREVRPLAALADLGDVLVRGSRPRRIAAAADRPEPCVWPPEDNEALGRAAAVSAAGAHHVLVESSEPLRGRRMARAIADLIRDVSSLDERSIARAHAAARLPPVGWGLMRRPHSHSAIAAVVGSWSRAGELSAAHGGVLFLEDLHDFAPSAVDGIVAGVQDGTVKVACGGGEPRQWPAGAVIVGQAGLCGCGKASWSDRCVCRPGHGGNHWRNSREIARLSPLRIRDGHGPGIRPRSDIAAVAERVGASRQRALGRGAPANAKLSAAQLRMAAIVTDGAERRLQGLVAAGRLSSRGMHTIVSTAVTLCDLDDTDAVIDEARISEALGLGGIEVPYEARRVVEAGGVEL